jgi:hypothetical protein
MCFASRLDNKLVRSLIRIQDGNSLDINRMILHISLTSNTGEERYRILDKVETIEHSRECDKHVFPTYIPSNTDTTTRSPPKMSLHNIQHMFIHKSNISPCLTDIISREVPFRVKAFSIMIFCVVGVDIVIITHKHSPRFKSISIILIILPIDQSIS